MKWLVIGGIVLKTNVVLDEFEQNPKVIHLNSFRLKSKPVYNFFKRMTDILCSGFALILLSPIFLVISLIIKLSDGGNVFFGQERVGKNGKIIKVYKFRSMKMNADSLENMLTPEEYEEYKKEYKLDNDPRVTKVGKILRKTSIDELPQLLSIVKGDMSIVGPRPILQDEMEENYSDYQACILKAVKPGLTGYWQAYARNNVGYENFERQKMELTYCRKRSMIFDIKIVFKTFKSVLVGSGAK